MIYGYLLDQLSLDALGRQPKKKGKREGQGEGGRDRGEEERWRMRRMKGEERREETGSTSRWVGREGAD